MVLVQKWPFFQLFFSGSLSLENVFYNIVEGKNAFLSYKNKKFKRSKNWYFSKAVNPWFWSKKLPFFQLFFLGNIAQGNAFYDILQRKNVFLSYKNKKFKSRKTDIFPKGLTHGFGPKVAIISTFLFRQYRPGKCL